MIDLYTAATPNGCKASVVPEDINDLLTAEDPSRKDKFVAGARNMVSK